SFACSSIHFSSGVAMVFFLLLRLDKIKKPTPFPVFRLSQKLGNSMLAYFATIPKLRDLCLSLPI
ncbi:MAG: hypothetical protein Q8O02_02995, partial [Candidatus Omnitrophota bacterium]|nr:hypothetical protein [Candidatus Omnitrophota bacterium]